MMSLMRTIAVDSHHIQNDTVVDHAVDGSHGGHRIFENALPIAEHKIGADQHGFAFIARGTSLLIMRPSLPQSSN